MTKLTWERSWPRPRVAPDFLPELACSDPCWALTTSAACEAANFTIWTQDGSSASPPCAWYGTYCAASCASYKTEIPCSMSHYDDEDGNERNVCGWVDQYYISTITAALVNLVAIIVLNGVRARASPGAKLWTPLWLISDGAC